MSDLLVNLAAGAVGALLGALAVYRFQIREGKKLGKGAARAVYIELVANMTTARLAASGDPELGSIRDDLYIAEAARLAAYLTPRELLAVSLSVRAGAGWRGGPGVDPGRWRSPALLLNARVWTASERAELERGVPGRD
jgi:hypothetical protein